MLDSKVMRHILWLIISVVAVFFLSYSAEFITYAITAGQLNGMSFWDNLIERTKSMFYAIVLISEYPLGLGQIERLKFDYIAVHNSFLGVGVVSGVLPFIVSSIMLIKITLKTKDRSWFLIAIGLIVLLNIEESIFNPSVLVMFGIVFLSANIKNKVPPQ